MGVKSKMEVKPITGLYITENLSVEWILNKLKSIEWLLIKNLT